MERLTQPLNQDELFDAVNTLIDAYNSGNAEETSVEEVTEDAASAVEIIDEGEEEPSESGGEEEEEEEEE